MKTLIMVNREDLHTVLCSLLHHSNGFRAHDKLEKEAADRLLEAVYGNNTVEPAKPVTVEPAKATTVKRVDTVKPKRKRKQ